MTIYPRSRQECAGGYVCMADAGERDVLVFQGVSGFEGEGSGAPLSAHNAAVLRERFPFTAPCKVLSRPQTLGTGDRLGIAGPGHIRVFRGCSAAPVLAQQSMRELTLTGRTFTDVLDAATFAVFREGYTSGYGADGDHLKNENDIRAALRAGCTMITLDCGEHIRPIPGGQPEDIFGGVVAFIKDIHTACLSGGEAELEISVDEAGETTTPEQHRFIASRLRELGVDFTSLAPRFPGEFQKGVDYAGDLAQFERELAEHAAIAQEYGHKLSVHSGSDKFSVFPILRKHLRGKFHLKTAGTSWLQAMRVAAEKDPALYRQAHAAALDGFEQAAKLYHVSCDPGNIPPLHTLKDDELPALFEQSDARQLIHITYGVILGSPPLKRRLYALWRREREGYFGALFAHIGKHIELLTGARPAEET